MLFPHPQSSDGDRLAAGLVVAAVVLFAALVPSSARAHAAFQDAAPQPGARLEAAPGHLTLAFTEPLNRRLTSARITEATSGQRVEAAIRVENRRLVLVPQRQLPTGAFRVAWHTVSALDGHALEGSFGFGVRTPAINGSQHLEQSPLARDGWLRATLRGGWYAAFLYFGGGLLTGMLLRSSRGPAGWLAVERSDGLGASGRDEVVASVAWRRTRMAGWLSATLAVGVALAETADAAGSLSWGGLDAYLLSTWPGFARVVAVVAVGVAAVAARRHLRLAAAALLLALAAVSVGGHANSASPRALALLTDWLHLTAATVWVGGIAQVVATWLPRLRRMAAAERRDLMSSVLPRFGRVALPAAAIVAAAGVGNALIELGRPAELWQSDYGRVLAFKVLVVAAIVAASYWHAIRLRPRLLAGDVTSPSQERKHWRALGSEPALGALAVVAAALLATFPLPPHQLLERAEAEGEPGAAAAAALRSPRRGELAVAEQAGPWMAAAWVRAPAGGDVTGTVRLLDFHVRPVAASVRIAGAAVRGCGTGCVTFRSPGTPLAIKVIARQQRRVHVAVVPVRWDSQADTTARALFARAVRATARLRTERIAERLTSGLGGGAAVSRYRIAGPHIYAVAGQNGGPRQTIVIGRRRWVRQPDGSWEKQVSDVLDTRQLMPWWTHRRGIRFLRYARYRGRPVAELALADIPRRRTLGPPFWFRLRIDLRSMRVLSMRMIAPGHFMDQRYFAFDSPVQVRPPPPARVS